MEKWQSDHMMNQLRCFGSMKKRYEMSVVVPIIMNIDLLEVKPILQQYVKRNNSKKDAFIDLYYPSLNLAIEIDEEYHDLRQTEDSEREQEIIDTTGCCFERFDAKLESFNIGTTIESIIVLIKSKIKEQKDLGTFAAWTEPEYKSLEELRKEAENTLFIKTKFDEGRPFIPEGAISQEIRDKTERVIMYSGSTEMPNSYIGHTVFDNVEFIQSETNENFYSPTGSTATQSQYLDLNANEWNAPRTFVCSYDLLNLDNGET